MVSRVNSISEIVPGKVNWTLDVRVIRLWTLPEFNNPLNPNSIEMILLDEKLDRIHCTVKSSLIPLFHSVLKEGKCYRIDKLNVTLNDAKFPTTRNKYKVAFMSMTACGPSRTPNIADKIPVTHFAFVSFSDILASPKDDLIVDVIGHIVEKSELKEHKTEANFYRLINLVLEDLESTRIQCTLWSDFAQQVATALDNISSSSAPIIVLQLCKLKKYQGVMGISNAFHGSKIFINEDLPDIVDYRSKMEASAVPLTQSLSQLGAPPVVSTFDAFMQASYKTIAEVLEARTVGTVVVLANVIDIESAHGWCYISCQKCYRKVAQVDAKFYCKECKRKVMGVARYKVELGVMDATGSINLMAFDRVVSNFIGIPAVDLVEAADEPFDPTRIPTEFQAFYGKNILFKIDIRDSNITDGWNNYTVRRMTTDPDILKQFMQLHSIQPFDLGLHSNNETDHAIQNPLTQVENAASIESTDALALELCNTPCSKLSVVSLGGEGNSASAFSSDQVQVVGDSSAPNNSKGGASLPEVPLCAEVVDLDSPSPTVARKLIMDVGGKAGSDAVPETGERQTVELSTPPKNIKPAEAEVVGGRSSASNSKKRPALVEIPSTAELPSSPTLATKTVKKKTIKIEKDK